MFGRSRWAMALLWALIIIVATTREEANFGQSPAIVRSAAAQEAAPRPLAPMDRGTCAKASTPAGTDEYCVSSVLKSDGLNIYSYGPENLFDDDTDTAWVEGVPGQGIGQWIVVAFDRIRLVKSIEIINGYAKDHLVFQKNSRVKDIKVEFSGRDEPEYFKLKDSETPQPVPLPDDAPLKAYWIKFTVESVYPGTKWEDTAISELRVVSELAQP
jgi:hypothetical protein